MNQRAHSNNAKRVVAVPQQQPWSEFGKEQLSWVRGQKLVCRKTSTSSHIEYKRRELFARRQGRQLLRVSREQSEKMTSSYYEIPFEEGVF